MTPETDPHVVAGLVVSIAKWTAGLIAGLVLLFFRNSLTRTQAEQDRINARLRELEMNSVTHDDLERLERKIDEHNKTVTDRLDKIFTMMTTKS